MARNVPLLSGPKMFIFEETLSFLLVFWVIYKKFTALISSQDSSFLVWEPIKAACFAPKVGWVIVCLLKEYVKKVTF